ncbi:MAG: hypothetical protein K2G60_03145 [Oscillospiraceae bacterium]|nr:hypothetical protein [Oscillospiraceae bacterium]
MSNKFHYCIGVKTNYGLMLVTKIDNRNRQCYWNEKEKPLAMKKRLAEDTALGLNLNGFQAVVVQSHTELNNHFIAVEKVPKRREEYTIADLNLLSAYERVAMESYKPFVEYRAEIDAVYFTRTEIISFEADAVQKRFLEALGVLEMSYSEWDKSKTAMKSEKELADLLCEKLLDRTLPLSRDDYSVNDRRLVSAYERVKDVPYKKRDAWEKFRFKPVITQRRLKAALEAIGMTYEEWSNSELKNSTCDEICQVMTDNITK